MNIQTYFLSIFVCVLLPNMYDGTLTYNYFDEMAQSYCASNSKGWVFALRRDCARGRAATCYDICRGATHQILKSIETQARRVTCFDGYHVRKSNNRLRDNPSKAQPDSNTVIFTTYGYGIRGCSWRANHCGLLQGLLNSLRKTNLSYR